MYPFRPDGLGCTAANEPLAVKSTKQSFNCGFAACVVKCLAARVAARSCRVFEQGGSRPPLQQDVPGPVTTFSQKETQGDLATVSLSALQIF